MTEEADHCADSLCMMKCSKCGACAHVMVCTHPDFLFNNIGYKPMHVLQRWLTLTDDLTTVVGNLQAAVYVQSEIATTVKSLERTDSTILGMASRVKNRLHEVIHQA